MKCVKWGKLFPSQGWQQRRMSRLGGTGTKPSTRGEWAEGGFRAMGTETNDGIMLNGRTRLEMVYLFVSGWWCVTTDAVAPVWDSKSIILHLCLFSRFLCAASSLHLDGRFPRWHWISWLWESDGWRIAIGTANCWPSCGSRTRIWAFCGTRRKCKRAIQSCSECRTWSWRASRSPTSWWCLSFCTTLARPWDSVSDHWPRSLYE